MKKILFFFVLTLLVVNLVSATERLTTQVEPSYPSPTMMQVYKIERIVLSPITSPIVYTVNAVHDFTLLNYGRARRFSSSTILEDKIDTSILEKSGPECDGTLVDVEILFYAPLMKFEEKKLRFLVPNIYIDSSHAGGIISTHKAIQIARLPSVKSITPRSYPSVDVVGMKGVDNSPPQSPFSGTCA